MKCNPFLCLSTVPLNVELLQILNLNDDDDDDDVYNYLKL